MSDYEFDPFASPAECEVPHSTHDSDEDFTILELLATDIEAVAAFDRYCSQAQFAKALRAIRSRDATIEALRRRVAELEEKLESCEASHDDEEAAHQETLGMVKALQTKLDTTTEIYDDTLEQFTKLRAENAELKRQVEALREACEAADDAFDKLDPAKDTRCGMAWRKVLEALREAAKGGE